MRRMIAGVVGLSLACSAAVAQFAGGVNIDFNQASGPGAGQPTILFGGAAGQGGYWNPVNGPLTSGSVRVIRDLGNSLNAVNCHITLSGGEVNIVGTDDPSTFGDAALLLDDAHHVGLPSAGAWARYAFTSFAPGVYEVYTYAIAPGSVAPLTRVEVSTNEASYGEQDVGGLMPTGGAFVLGDTHAKHTVALSVPGMIAVDAAAGAWSGWVNGFQIKRLNPTRLYVASDGTAVGDGLTWGTALRSLQWALAVAAATPSVTEIWVKQGTYKADGYPAAAGSTLSTFRMRANLSLYGGFTGTETTLAGRPPNLYGSGTVLDGAFTAGGGRVNTVVTANGAGTTAVLEGFDIRNGGSGFVFGGGLYTNDCSPQIRHCTFRDNEANEGGGAFVDGTGDVLFQDCLFMRNTASGGSAVRSTSGAGTSVTMRRCAVVGNTCMFGTSGTIGLWCSLVMENCLVANNDGWSWIMDLSPSPSVSMVNCTLANNRGTSQVGTSPNVGVSLGHSSTIRNCIIWGNTGNDGGLPTMTGVLRNAATDTLNVSDNIVQGWDGALAGPAFLNFAADPQFLSPAAAGNTPSSLSGDYRLRSRSPARDSGWNAAAPAGPDLTGSPRIVDDIYFPNTGFEGGTVDRGCYEGPSSSVPCPGDVGRAGGLPGADGLRNNNDFIAFISLFFALDARADLGRGGGLIGSDGSHDNNDFIAFISLFFTECP